ncbi:defensin-like protein 206 [Eutrema salsugineum]|uniref:defensin-like protein 206 n=1 Tax=Eutrema salsugineum TaxID=72664 RepID=UPI000CED4C79|nr:defensin-like protein 206 [Eutrema salsugineum]
MAKNLNSISFTVLLLVLVIASTGFLKSEAAGCGTNPCTSTAQIAFLDECPDAHGKTNAECCTCCKNKYGSPPVCWAAVEGSDIPKHCHCYKRII